MFVYFTDSDTDMTPAIAAKYGYHIISMPYSIDGETIYPYESFSEFDAHTFYDSLRGGVLPTTSAISTEKYKAYFEPILAAGNDILYIHFSASMSATFDSMRVAVKELLEKYPDRRFETIDTKGISICALAILEEIGDMILAGKTADEIIAWSKTEVDHYATYFFADNLKFFKRSGRVSGLTAAMGTVIGIRPIISMCANGKMENIGKERGKIKAIERLVQYVEELGDNIRDHHIIVGHADAPELAEQLKAAIYEKIGSDLNIETVYVNPTAGSHCGPDSLGVVFHATRR